MKKLNNCTVNINANRTSCIQQTVARTIATQQN